MTQPVQPQALAEERLASPYRWYHKVSSLFFIVFCMELGLFLLVYPWTDHWTMNYFAAMRPGWYEFWRNGYVRGGVSGVGILNLYVALTEIFRLRRFAGAGTSQ